MPDLSPSLRIAERLSDLLPASGICPSALHRRPVRQQRIPVRSRNLEADFHSPVWTSPLPVSPGGVSAPALLLQLLDAYPADPVRLDLYPRLVSRTTGDIYGQDPLPAESAPTLSAAICLPLPLRAFTLPDQCAQANPPSRRLTIRIARSPFAPHQPLVFTLADGSSFQVRFVSSGSLFREPLGTNLTMQHFQFSVKRKRSTSGLFSQTLFSL